MLVIVAAAILVAELLIMFLLPHLTFLPEDTKSIIDAVLLTVLVLPLLYFLLFRPMTIQARERSKTYNQLIEVMDTLERGKREWEYTVDSLPEFITLLDESGRSIRANRTIEKWGIAKVREVRGQEYHELIHRHCDMDSCNFYVLWREAWDKALQGDPAQFEIFDKELDKSLLVSVRSLRGNKDASSQNFTVVVHDISSAQKMKEMLVQRQKALHAVYEMTIASEKTMENKLTRILLYVSELLGSSHIILTIKDGPKERAVAGIPVSVNDKTTVFEIKGAPTEAVYKQSDTYQLGEDEIASFSNTGMLVGPCCTVVSWCTGERQFG